jgi:hypothetical protein
MKTQAMTLLALMASLALGTAEAGDSDKRGRQTMETIVVTAERPLAVEVQVEAEALVADAPAAVPVDFDALTLTPPKLTPAERVVERSRGELAHVNADETRS